MTLETHREWTRSCVVCGRAEAEIGDACGRCLAPIQVRADILPQHVSSHVLEPSHAGFIDRWGRFHTVGARTPIGRRPLKGALALLDRSISRNHAEIDRTDDGHWVLRDLRSTNGTFVNEKQLHGEIAIRSGDVVFFGVVGLIFTVSNVEALTCPPPSMEGRIPRIYHPEDDSSRTQVGLPFANIRLLAPAAGNGGVCYVDDHCQQLSYLQFEFVRILHDRMLRDVEADDLVRGFVPSAELIASLPWDTRQGSDANLKQIVRRVRRGFVRAGIGDVIESRHGFGYRMRVRPQQ
jgi:pSer/pThr/pTyr-binding forkhead associated (FHA) protein